MKRAPAFVLADIQQQREWEAQARIWNYAAAALAAFAEDPATDNLTAREALQRMSYSFRETADLFEGKTSGRSH